MADKPPIVLIHGACSQPAHFDAWRAFFTAAGYACVAPALPGHAPSNRAVLRRQGFADYLDAMRAVVTGLGTRPIVIGHSMGGLIARMLAAEGLCAAIVLVAPLPAGRVPAPAGALPYYAAVAPFVVAGLPFRPWPGRGPPPRPPRAAARRAGRDRRRLRRRIGPRLPRPGAGTSEGEAAGGALSDARPPRRRRPARSRSPWRAASRRSTARRSPSSPARATG